MHEITLVTPFPIGEGAGGWGLKRKLKAGQAGDKESTPPPHFFTFSPCQRRADVIQYAIESETV